MLDEKKSTLHFVINRHAQDDALSLLPLKMVLINAEKEAPPRAPKRAGGVDEELVLKLIRGVKQKYKKTPILAKSVRGDGAILRNEAGDCFGASERRLAMT